MDAEIKKVKLGSFTDNTQRRKFSSFAKKPQSVIPQWAKWTCPQQTQTIISLWSIQEEECLFYKGKTKTEMTIKPQTNHLTQALKSRITHSTSWAVIPLFLYSLPHSRCVRAHCGAGSRLVEFDVSFLCCHEYLIRLTIPRRFHPNES